MLQPYRRISNISAAVAVVCLTVSLVGQGPGASSSSSWLALLAPTAMGLFTAALWVAFWAYARAKGRSGWLGVFLPFLSVLGLLILLMMKDKSGEADGDSPTGRRDPVLLDGNTARASLEELPEWARPEPAMAASFAAPAVESPAAQTESVQHEAGVENHWWYGDGEDRRGPFAPAQLEALVRNGTIGLRTLVWRHGRMDWKPLEDVEELAFLLPALPPQLPAQASRRAVLAMDAAGPWRRFFAQLFDIWTLCAPVGFVLGFVGNRFWPEFGLWLSSPSSSGGLALMLVPLALLAEAILFGLFGTTPGKLILGVRVTTLDGARPTFAQYVGRMAGLYWYGLGLSIPIVNLITMGQQYAKVKGGQPTSYDVGRFHVKAAGMGAFRAVAATLSLVALFVLVGFLNNVELKEKAKYFAGFSWTNPLTGREASVPRGWVYAEQRNDLGDPIHVFSSKDAGVVAVFAMDAAAEDLPLERYQQLWSFAVRKSMAMESRAVPANVTGRFGLESQGRMADDQTRRIHLTLVKSGRQVWRVVLVGTSGREPNTAQTQKLRDALFQTLAPEAPGERQAAGV